jgi:hypothetical protein
LLEQTKDAAASKSIKRWTQVGFNGAIVQRRAAQSAHDLRQVRAKFKVGAIAAPRGWQTKVVSLQRPVRANTAAFSAMKRLAAVRRLRHSKTSSWVTKIVVSSPADRFVAH